MDALRLSRDIRLARITELHSEWRRPRRASIGSSLEYDRPASPDERHKTEQLQRAASIRHNFPARHRGWH